jgi:hypothetical protein
MCRASRPVQARHQARATSLPLLTTCDAHGHAWAALGAGLPGAEAEKGHDPFDLLPSL